jgi:O-antigen ligase
MEAERFAESGPWPLPKKIRGGLGIFRGSIRHSIGEGLLYLVILEAAIFGSGRLLQVGPVTVKMLLFGLTIVFTAWSLLALDRIRTSTTLLTASFLALLGIAAVSGLGHDARMERIGNDVSPLLSFLVLPFFELTIRSKRILLRVIKIMILGAILLVAGYAAIFVSLAFKLVSFASLYQWINTAGPDDFIFEGSNGSVFYKGAIYIAIGIFFLMFQKRLLSKVIAIGLSVSFVMVGSRGFFIAIAVAAMLYVAIGPLRLTTKLALFTLAILLGIALVPVVAPLLVRHDSDEVRTNTIAQVGDRATVPTIIIGHGFGVGVPERLGHMEIAYLEIFHKQGLVGLFWWAAMFACIAIRFARAISRGNGEIAYPLLLTVVFIVVESATNSFVDNPIGIYPILIAFVGFGVLSQSKDQKEITVPRFAGDV